MEQKTILNEILGALNQHSVHVDNKFDQLRNDLESKMDNMRNDLESKMDNMRNDMGNLEQKMDKGFSRLGKKVDGIRVELTETKETTDYVLSRTLQHDKKLRQLSEQQK
ncbi:hypothetical protein [Oceanobacillus bengalensis]|uniref:Uncharacterized protein n=1 Tax=Oceanobacillus bengalensis TaxID=1435466 RepID=A0A494Z455_9BACI|nr:hypothetical protein [Oceanobacillus bengalensis]RKQ17093.1 hypothetical protein D8M05_05325 [Oceanobacillus bengalensis]